MTICYISHRVECHRQKSIVEEVNLNLNTKIHYIKKNLEHIRKTLKSNVDRHFLNKIRKSLTNERE